MKKTSSAKSSVKSSRFGKFILALCELVMGVVLLINPVGFTTAVITIFGILLLVAGIVSALRYFRMDPEVAAQGEMLTQGLLEVIAGLFCILRSDWFIVTFPLLTVLYGVITMVTGIAKIQWTVDLVRAKAAKWFWAAISAVVTLVCSAVILCNPFTSTAVLWTFIAVTLIVEAVFDVIVVIFAKRGSEQSVPYAPEVQPTQAVQEDGEEL